MPGHPALGWDRPIPPDPDDVRTADLGPFRFASGARLPMEVAYETYGDRADPTVLVCHALTGSQHVVGDGRDQAHGWWTDVVGPGRPIDTDRYFVVCANVPGSCYGTTGPASPRPRGGGADAVGGYEDGTAARKPYGSDFPPVRVADWTRAQRRLLDHLGIDRLHAVIGGSVGGMNVLDWARRYPDLVDRIVPVATGARLEPRILAIDAVGREAIRGDPAFAGGDYYPDHPDHGLAQARRLAHVTYRSAVSLRRQFGRERADDDGRGTTVSEDDAAPATAIPGDGRPVDAAGVEAAAAPATDDAEVPVAPTFEVASYLDYNADRFVDRFDANSYLRLLGAMDAFDLAAGAESDAAALEGFDGAALVVSFADDWHFPTHQSERLTAALREAGADATHHVVDAAYGHDAFLTETDRYADDLRAFLAGGPAGPRGSPRRARWTR